MWPSPSFLSYPHGLLSLHSMRPGLHPMETVLFNHLLLPHTSSFRGDLWDHVCILVRIFCLKNLCVAVTVLCYNAVSSSTDPIR